MKIIFLDFDGVLNSEKYLRQQENYGVIINPDSLILLKEIIESTNAKIVLSTSWREHWEKYYEKCDETGKKINDIFTSVGLSIFDKTPFLADTREKEIEEWLKNHTDVENFVVFDDRFLDSKLIRNHFVKTDNYRGGINKENVRIAKEILNK